MIHPDYAGGSIVNLMASLSLAMDGGETGYAGLRSLDQEILARSRHIVLIVVDGLGYKHLQSTEVAPALQAHLKGSVTSVFPSTTATAITTFMTGLAPQQHALTGWFSWLGELGCVAAVLPFRPRYGGVPFSEMGVEAKKVFGLVPFFDRIDAVPFVVSPGHIVDSDFNATHSGRAARIPYHDLDEFFEAIRSALVAGAHGQRKYGYAYYPDIDSAAHMHGIGSEKVASLLKRFDEAFGSFSGSLQGSGTTVIVTGDHGFIDSPPNRCIQLADHPALAETLLLPLCGERRAAYCYVRTGKHRQFESYVKEHLGEFVHLLCREELMEGGWLGQGTPHPRLAERIGDYVLIMKDNWCIKDWIPGERHYAQLGVHGGVSAAEMQVPLVVMET